MIRFCVMLFFVCLSAEAQKLELQIDTITVEDSDATERKFVVQYHLENLTDETLRFFLDTSGIIPSTGGSGSTYPFYKIYEEDTFLEMGSVFSGWGRTEINLEGIEEKEIEGFLLKHQKKLDSIRESKRDIRNKMMTMAPREVKKFSMDFYWDRNRYYQRHDMEYYLEEEAQHFLEITIVLQKHIYHQQLPEALFYEIIADPYFIEGAFTSNKMAIDFKTRK